MYKKIIQLTLIIFFSASGFLYAKPNCGETDFSFSDINTNPESDQVLVCLGESLLNDCQENSINFNNKTVQILSGDLNSCLVSYDNKEREINVNKFIAKAKEKGKNADDYPGSMAASVLLHLVLENSDMSWLDYSDDVNVDQRLNFKELLNNDFIKDVENKTGYNLDEDYNSLSCDPGYNIDEKMKSEDECRLFFKSSSKSFDIRVYKVNHIDATVQNFNTKKAEETALQKFENKLGCSCKNLLGEDFDIENVDRIEYYQGNLHPYEIMILKDSWILRFSYVKEIDNQTVVSFIKDLVKEIDDHQDQLNQNTGFEKTEGASGESLYKNLKGKIVLRVEKNGEAYYINPEKQEISFLGRPKDAFEVMRNKGRGIKTLHLEKIPIGLTSFSGHDSDGDGLSDLFENAIGTNKNIKDTDNDGYSDREEIENQFNPNGLEGLKIDQFFSEKQKGKIFLQVEDNGEAWYVCPDDGKRYFLGRPADAFQIMRDLGLGISDISYNRLNEYVSLKNCNHNNDCSDGYTCFGKYDCNLGLNAPFNICPQHIIEKWDYKCHKKCNSNLDCSEGLVCQNILSASGSGKICVSK